jgi:heme oxygenase (biliverdin-IX-beta and delta-forming)
MILKRLKSATNSRHVALERQLPLLDPGFSRPAYRQFTRRFFGYYAPLESQLMALPWWDSIGFDYQERQKTPRLVQDLTAMGDTAETLAQLPRCQHLPATDNLAHLLGCLYVIEGATLGGQIITKHLQTNLGVTPTQGGAFFNGYGAHTGPHWLAFGKMLMAHAEGTGNGDDIIDGANQTFATLDQWLFPTPQEQAATL